MASVNGITIEFGQLHGFKRKKEGMRQIRSTDEMQAHLIGIADGMAASLNRMYMGSFGVGPDYFGTGMVEPVTSTRHGSPEGAHAFVRTEDALALEEQDKNGALYSIL